MKNPKREIRMPKEYRNPKPEGPEAAAGAWGFRPSGFGFLSGFAASDFGFHQ
jgi:hypothetical protein